MKKIAILSVAAASALALTACGGTANVSSSETTVQTETTAQTSTESQSVEQETTIEAETTAAAVGASWDGTYESKDPESAEIVNAVDAETLKQSITGTFSIEAESSNSYSTSGSTYTITKTGEYTLSGALNGNIVIDAGDDDEIELILDGVSITSDDAAPIYVANADKVKITAKDGSYNEIIDGRSARSDDEEEVTDASNASAAIYSTCDLIVKGQGALVVTGGYNNGIHTKDDLDIKNLTLKVTAENNALKGNDSVTIESGEIVLIASGGDGIKTKNSDVSSKGNQKGNVDIQGGTIDIYTQYDGIDAAYDVYTADGCNLNIYTGSYDTAENTANVASAADSNNAASGINAEAEAVSLELAGNSDSSVISDVTLTSDTLDFGGFGGFGFGRDSNDKDNSNTESQKGIKADNQVIINGGNINIASDDDGLHGNAGTELENGETGAGTVTVNAGTITIATGDDGIHADTDLTVNGGKINITTSYEGLEGHVITINDGYVWAYATDDAFNASTAYINSGASIEINGGYVDVTTPSGDTDAVDSNGNYTQNGGFVLVKGGSTMGQNAGSVDVDGSITVTGGAIVAVGGICETPTNSVNAYAASGQQMSAGNYELVSADGDTVLTFTLGSSYSSFWVCSELLETGTEYNLNQNGSSVLNWTQEEGTMGSSGMSGMGGMGNMGGGHGGNGGGRGGSDSGTVDPGAGANGSTDIEMPDNASNGSMEKPDDMPGGNMGGMGKMN